MYPVYVYMYLPCVHDNNFKVFLLKLFNTFLCYHYRVHLCVAGAGDREWKERLGEMKKIANRGIKDSE